nr:FAD-dependent oxidoreductase [Myxococcota bacterium]
MLCTEQLELAQVPEGEWPGVYLLGTPASRITIADQQKRAFNLVASLVASGRVRPETAIAIVGAGVAGATAAVYATRLDLKVAVFEQHGDAMMIQQGSSRWLHPNLYDWPRPNWSVRHTAFPCMNWTANTAANVVAELRAEWRHAVSSGALTWMADTPISSLTRLAGVGWALNGTQGPFETIILAMGFGEDAPVAPSGRKPYWRDDDLHQRIRSSATVLVSGCGDGGLVDALRAMMLDFRHERLVDLCKLGPMGSISDEIIAIDADRPRYPDGHGLTQAFLALNVPSSIDNAIAALLKPNVHVTLNGTADAPLTRT